VEKTKHHEWPNQSCKRITKLGAFPFLFSKYFTKLKQLKHHCTGIQNTDRTMEQDRVTRNKSMHMKSILSLTRVPVFLAMEEGKSVSSINCSRKIGYPHTEE
jgi:hypothetical protein